MFSLRCLLPLMASLAIAAKIPPSQDPFYTPTGDWQSAKPGTILAHRDVPNKLVNIDYSAAYQLLYRTTDSLGNATAAVTTVIIPQNSPDYSRLLSYQVVYDTPDVDCSPSYALQEGGIYIIDTGFTYGLSAGWIVNTPDYEGPKAAFTAGIISGQATLDSIRAALASTSITKLESNATVAMWGYSGGALASQWAAELQAAYAPELNISGSALGGLTPNVTSVALSVNDGPDAGLIAAGVLGMAAAYPNISSLLNTSFVSTADETAFYEVKKECIAQIGTSDAGKDIFSYFKEGQKILTDPRTQFAVQAGGIMGIHGTPLLQNKLYVYKSTLDEVSPIADTDALVNKYCAQGLSIQYIRDNFGNHSAEATAGGLGAIEFLVSIFNGSNNQTGCVIETQNQAGDNVSSTSIAATTTPTPVSASTGTGASATGASGSAASGSAASGSTGASPTSSTGAAPTAGPMLIQMGLAGGLAAMLI